MAMRAPLNCMSPYCATGPVLGPAMPILMLSAASVWQDRPARIMALSRRVVVLLIRLMGVPLLWVTIHKVLQVIQRSQGAVRAGSGL
ncbi:hypothetical protein D3C81_2117160 [compost metagenome]